MDLKLIIAVQGTTNFNDYNVFMRSMAVGMSMLPQENKEILVYSVGPKNINNFVTEFCNITERSLKARGIKIRYNKVPESWAQENLSKFNYFIFLSKPGEYNSKLVAQAELSGVEVGLFRY
jgi:hypothetical protein